MRSVTPPIDPACVGRVRDRLPRPSKCPNCGSKVFLVKNNVIYGREFGAWPYAYLCRTKCSYVGVHPGTDIPLGEMADERTRRCRQRAKRIFNSLWKGKRTRFRKRRDAYQWLADQLELEVSECHFGWFDAETANRAGEICWRESVR